jgi:hypothetical protein
MRYIIAYDTSVGMLTIPALNADEAMGQARQLLNQGRSYVKIIDAEGRRLDLTDLERRAALGRA